jgi:hypothetical protein
MVTSANIVVYGRRVNSDPDKMNGLKNQLQAPLPWSWVNIEPDEN